MSTLSTSPGARAPAPPDPRQGRRTAERPRLAVFRSNKGIFAQLIDDESARRSPRELARPRQVVQGLEDRASAAATVAAAAKKAGIEDVVFDRGGYYHGRVKALAERACAD